MEVLVLQILNNRILANKKTSMSITKKKKKIPLALVQRKREDCRYKKQMKIQIK